jgi:hypothetical protein
MRPLLSSALFLSVAMASIAAAAVQSSTLTIVLEFKGPHSARAVAEMKREFESVMKDTGLTFGWRLRSEPESESAANLVLVKFRGKCVLEPVGYLYDERGPLAFTYSSDGAVQPFAEVACDQVTAAVRSAMFGGDFGKADLLLGRALGRVLAHEVVHMLSRSGSHGKQGVEKAALSGRELVAPDLRLSPADAGRTHPRVP